jgi:hypothetical protein
LLGLTLGGWAQESSSTPFVPRAYHTDKPAIFGFQILQTKADKAGTPIVGIYRLCVGPWLLGMALLPIYWQATRRKGLRIQ